MEGAQEKCDRESKERRMGDQVMNGIIVVYSCL